MACNLWRTVEPREEIASGRHHWRRPNRGSLNVALVTTRIFETTRSSCSLGILIVIAIGGFVEIVPLFYLKSTIEKVDGMRPYTPLELAGRNIYVREGCYLCHSQMIRAAARRGRALRPLLARSREHVRPTVPVGLQAHRTRTSHASAASIPTTGIATI